MRNKSGDGVGQDGAINAFAKDDNGVQFQIIVDPRSEEWDNDSAILKSFYPLADGQEAFSGNIWSLQAFADFVNAVLAERNHIVVANKEKK
jgi:hypothetical protein